MSGPAITQGRDILFAIFDIMLLAIRHKYPLQCWKTVWTLFIKKELSNPHLDRLHCIMIFEANWQLLLKWHSSYGFLPKTKEAGTLRYAQGGGRKGHSAIDQAAQQIVETEITHLHQQTAINLYLDLRQCFDMMVEACHNLACRRHGADDAYLRLHAKTHQAMKYYVRHKFGISNNYNTFAAHPWHGAGQGAADAALWYIALSDTLIDAYHTKVATIAMSDPVNNVTILRSLKAFIDDVVLHASANPLTTYKTLKQQAQDQLRWWNKLIQVTGGSLNHKKCCALTYYWTPDWHGILTLSPPDNLDTIILEDDTNQQPITNISLNQGTCYLGLYITGDRNTVPMEQHLWQIALKYTATFQ